VKMQLVMRIKGYQRHGEEERNSWAAFCDTHFCGVRDPARLDVSSLQHFATTFGI